MSTITENWPVQTRHLFPCWDEPLLKATFEVKLTVPEIKVQLSNTQSNHEENSKIICFDKTPRMSTYHFALIIGNYDYIEKMVEDRICVRIYTAVGAKDQAQFALDCVDKILRFYERYFGVKYPLPKLDLVAADEDLGTEAISNLGLVILKDCHVLYDKDSCQGVRQQSIVEVLSRELAYQWFGNIVTAEW